ncbi:S-adenosylmethionine decarboxylase [Candidatus Woesearchaeota archaeon]|nr:S-adenosylmethionine decarboxylase [Candidatus Woesearchaeota archaeon]
MLGTHIIGVINGKNLDLSNIDQKITKAANLTGLKIVRKASYRFSSNKGATYCFILSQSHLIIHTWPEKDSIAFDLFTCGGKGMGLKAVRRIAEYTNGKIKKLKTIRL